MKNFKPFIIVKFKHEHIKDWPYEDGNEKRLRADQQTKWQQLLSIDKGLSLKKLFRSVSVNEIKKNTERVKKKYPNYDGNILFGYFYLKTDPKTNLDILLKEVSAWHIVEHAYIEIPGPSPFVNVDTNLVEDKQGYLAAAPLGIGATKVWPKRRMPLHFLRWGPLLYFWRRWYGIPGGAGEGQSFADIELDWLLNHKELIGQNGERIVEEGEDVLRFLAEMEHGVAVLCIICATAKTNNLVGIAPEIKKFYLVSYKPEDDSPEQYDDIYADAIEKSFSRLSSGDVLLLEIQNEIATGPQRGKYGPVELGNATYEVLYRAWGMDIVVIEPAGNGNETNMGANLDDYPVLSERDSGAIMVTAATSSEDHLRKAYANYGQRIDCFAWGENIFTCYSEPKRKSSTNLTQTNFGGTSGASAIIAGAALVAQGIAEKNKCYRLSPYDLRRLFRTEGTCKSREETTSIGIMPDLDRIASKILWRRFSDVSIAPE